MHEVKVAYFKHPPNRHVGQVLAGERHQPAQHPLCEHDVGEFYDRELRHFCEHAPWRINKIQLWNCRQIRIRSDERILFAVGELRRAAALIQQRNFTELFLPRELVHAANYRTDGLQKLHVFVPQQKRKVGGFVLVAHQGGDLLPRSELAQPAKVLNGSVEHAVIYFVTGNCCFASISDTTSTLSKWRQHVGQIIPSGAIQRAQSLIQQGIQDWFSTLIYISDFGNKKNQTQYHGNISANIEINKNIVM